MLDIGDRRRKARERKRRYRARVDADEVVVPLVVSLPVVEFLIAAGWLARARSEDRTAIAAAIAELLGEAIMGGAIKR